MSAIADISKYKIELWPVENLTPYELNVKKHEKAQVGRIVQSIQNFGWRGNPILVDRHGVIIAGHGRRLAAIEMGLPKVPVQVAADLNEEQVRALRLADNRAAEGDIDTEMLAQELSDLGVDLLTGIFDAKELEFMTADLGEMRTDVFVTDMDTVVAEQQAELGARTAAAKGARIALHKAFGFKDVSTDNQRVITTLMGKAEAYSGLKGEEALAKFVEETMQ